MGSGRSPLVPLACGAAGMLLLGIASATGAGGAGHVGPAHWDPLQERATVTATPAPASAAPAFTPPPLPTREGTLLPRWLLDALGAALVVAVALAVCWFVVRVARQVHVRRTDEAEADAQPVPVVVDVADLHRATERSLDELRVTDDVRAAIIACWRRLEDLCAVSGAVRENWQSTGEYVLDVLATTPAPATDLRTLARLHDDACYAADEPGSEARGTAVGCLERISEALAATPGGPGDAAGDAR